MADNQKAAKKSPSPDELLSDQAEKDREAVLEEDPAIAVSKRASESDNREILAADTFVNAEKTAPAERASFGRRTLVTNHTVAGLPADVHQALVSSSRLRREDAMAFREVQAVLVKYTGSHSDLALPEDVRGHLEDELNALELPASLDESARVLLEKYT